MHTPARGIAWVAFSAIAFLFIAGETQAQVQAVSVNKSFNYNQTGPATVSLDTASNNYGFGVDVDGNNIGSITAPTVTGPFGGGIVGSSFHNNGKLTYSAGDRGWRYGLNGNDAGYSSQAQVDSFFPSGVYTVHLNGTTVSLSLTGNAYPNAPTLALSGGEWQDGVYVIDPAQTLTVTTNAFNAYGTHADDGICMAIAGGNFKLPFTDVGPQGCLWAQVHQLASAVPGQKTASFSMPPGSLQNGQDYLVLGAFIAIVDVQPNAALPSSRNTAHYSVGTLLHLRAESKAFPMTVTGSVGPTTANVTANFQPRPQDVGTKQSVYVFALAPASLAPHAATTKSAPVKGHTGLMRRDAAKDGPVQCVLAQVNSSGQLQQVSASTMQAYTTGVLGAQGQSVSVLNNVPTSNIAGSTTFLGYGTDAQSMLTNGVNQEVVSAPGGVACTPQPPETGWWWNADEPTRGYSIEVQGNRFFFAVFQYDVSGRATWNVASGAASMDGSYLTGDLLNVTGGVTLGGAYKPFTGYTTVGTVTLQFSDAQHGVMTWPGGTTNIVRQPVAPDTLSLVPLQNVPQTGWWWNPAEAGRGFFIEWQGDWIDLVGYMYDDAGNPVWYITAFEVADPRSMSGNWWTFANGPVMGQAFKPGTRTSDNFAPVSITFTGPDTGLMTLPNGRSTQLIRERF